MFDVGFWEISLIFVILLIVVGPERLPQLARTAGVWISKARRMVASVKAEVEQELKLEEVKRSIQQQTKTDDFKQLADQVKSINSDLKSTGQEIKSSVEAQVNDVNRAAEAAVTPKTKPDPPVTKAPTPSGLPPSEPDADGPNGDATPEPAEQAKADKTAV